MRKRIEKTIDDQNYRLTQLGAETISDLGFALVEAGIRKDGLAKAMKSLRGALADACEVQVAGKWCPLTSLVDWWDERPRSHGHWLAWATEAGGLPDFFLGTTQILPPQFLRAVRGLSGFPLEQAGGSTDSSSAPVSASPPGQS